MSQQEANQGVNPQQTELDAKNQDYADSLHQSKLSVISHTSSPQNLLKYFQQYNPNYSLLNMSQLHGSSHLKLKKYKQSVFYGQFINGRRHGKGVMIYDSGRLYQGEWQNDYKHGAGYEKFPNQCIYQGDYVNGKPEGVGRYSWPNSQFYEGQWVNGMKHGSGMWRGVKGDSYIGEWKFGKADGYGVHVWVNGDRYEGQFKECLKHGEGIQKFANSDIYKGLYANGKPSGYGQYYWANGSYFKGLFRNGLRDGQGMWKKSPGNSDKYEGQYSNDKKNGYGIFTWASGNVYKGNYEADTRYGYGQMYWNDGSFYKGEWRKGIQHGQGQIYVPSQGYKKGIFEDNILIIVEKQADAIYHQTDPQKSLQPSASKKGSIPSKVSFRSRGFSYSSKNKKRQTVSIDEGSVVRYTGKQAQNHPLLPKKFNKQRQPKYITLDRRTLKPRQPGKQRLLHSSFYMHKLHTRGAASVQGSRAEANQNNWQPKKKDMMQQMGYSRQNKAIQDRYKH